MRLIPVTEAQKIIEDVVNDCIYNRKISKTNVAHMAIYKLGIAASVEATKEQFIELAGNKEMRFDDES